MRTLTTAGLVLLAMTTDVRGVCPGGGLDETSERFFLAGGNWAEGSMTPGTVAAGLTGTDLLLTEVSYLNDFTEFVEIYNPTSNTIDLAQYYLSDHSAPGPRGYWEVVLGGAYAIPTTDDFNVKFPTGRTIAPGQVLVIWAGANGGILPPLPLAPEVDFEIASGTFYTDMIPVGNVPATTGGLLADGSRSNGEVVMLYKWDGVCDLVCDVDYVGWGDITSPTPAQRVDKTGVTIDGVDGDALSSAYLADTAIALQLGQTHVSGKSLQRIRIGQHSTGGNGCLSQSVAVEMRTWGFVKSHYR